MADNALQRISHYDQFAIAWLSLRIRPLQRAVKAEPRVLLYRGQPLPDAVRRERITIEGIPGDAIGPA